MMNHSSDDPTYVRIAPPPPPWSLQKPRCRRRVFPIIVIVAVMALGTIFSGAVLFFMRNAGITHPASTGAAIPTSYTAANIMQDINAAGIHPKFIEYNRTIWSWSMNTYTVSVNATSSADFTDDSACTGYCSPQDIGLWVYGSQNDAIEAYNEVSADERQQGAIPMMGTPGEVLHGRCLLLGTNAQSIYGQVAMRDCV